MPERTSRVAHEYAGRKLTVGEAFECEEQHVKLLLHLGRIEPEEGDAGYKTRDLSANTPAGYLRRDMHRKKIKAA